MSAVAKGKGPTLASHKRVLSHLSIRMPIYRDRCVSKGHWHIPWTGTCCQSKTRKKEKKKRKKTKAKQNSGVFVHDRPSKNRGSFAVSTGLTVIGLLGVPASLLPLQSCLLLQEASFTGSKGSPLDNYRTDAFARKILRIVSQSRCLTSYTVNTWEAREVHTDAVCLCLFSQFPIC